MKGDLLVESHRPEKRKGLPTFMWEVSGKYVYETRVHGLSESFPITPVCEGLPDATFL